MEWQIIHIDETDSTNRWLKEHLGENRPLCVEKNRPLCVVADYQTAGRGCGSNTWESERGKNLTFSLLIHPENLPANRQFAISEWVSVALCETLEHYLSPLASHHSPLTSHLSPLIKWPNDIYWRDSKLAGILIENTLKGNLVKDSIIGIGLNVNQREFHSDAPNPVSLWQITGQETNREQLLQDILQAFAPQKGAKGSDPCAPRYAQMLYRREGYHRYADKDGEFMAEMMGVEPDGHLLLRDDSGQERRYAFKEVTFII